jgi:hypothetical protein
MLFLHPALQRSNPMSFILSSIKVARLKEMFMEEIRFGLSFAFTMKNSLKRMLSAFFAKKT